MYIFLLIYYNSFFFYVFLSKLLAVISYLLLAKLSVSVIHLRSQELFRLFYFLNMPEALLFSPELFCITQDCASRIKASLFPVLTLVHVYREVCNTIAIIRRVVQLLRN